MVGSRWTHVWSLGLCLAGTAVTSGLQAVRADVVIMRGRSGGTPYSYAIHAQADYVRARGQFEKSVAQARKIHAEAAAVEMENWVNYVDAFFLRRQKNREWRAKERTSYLEHLGKYDDAQRLRITQHQQAVMDSDVTEGLNWLLKELSGPAFAYEFISRKDAADYSDLNVGLAPENVEPLRFTDGKLVFSAVSPKPLDSQWPLLLRADSFAPLCQQFESARDQLLREIKENGTVSSACSEKLITGLNELLVALDKAYPLEVRKNELDLATRLNYFAAVRYLKSLLHQTHQATQSVDAAVFDGALEFKGDTIMDLVQHMDRYGLNFARPEPGGERAYRSLFLAMRKLYVAWNGTNGGDNLQDSTAGS